MKAVLVIDTMPNNCSECWLHHFEYATDIEDWEDVCHNAEHESHILCKTNYKIRPSWCPLRPLPEIKYISLTDTHDDLIFQMGWNACLDEIVGETE